MVTLTPDEARVLGVLIEKAFTTPDQYPLSVNAIVSGCNQKNNRDPIVTFDDDAALDAVNGLREKGLCTRVETMGGRTPKYRQELGTKLQLGRPGLAILAELMLRGPQTLGELRGRASRMSPFETLDHVLGTLDALTKREPPNEPLVKQIPPAPGSRAERYAQLLAPDAHDLSASPATAGAAAAVTEPAAPGLAARVESLEGEVLKLKDALRSLATKLGEADPLG